MGLLSNLDQQIRLRFEKLIAEGEQLLGKMHAEEEAISARNRAKGAMVIAGHIVSKTEFASFQVKVTSLLQLFSLGFPHIQKLQNEVGELKSMIGSAERIVGIVQGLKDDYETGMLNSLQRLIETNIVTDYLGQAEQLLGEGIKGEFDYVPAAVLAGAILEDALRRLCQRQEPPIDINRSNGNAKTLGTLIDDLKAVGLYNELTAKQLRAWAGIRNAAAHGKFAEFTREQVENFIPGLRDFLAKYI